MDIQKTMEFILEQQAASVAKQAVFETNIARLMEAQYNSEQRIARNEEAIEVLIESQQRLGEYIEKVSSGLDHLKDRVDALVLVVDSMIHRPPAA